MKKRIIALLLCMTTLTTVTACGNGKDNTTETTEAEVRSSQIDVDVDKQVKMLGNYDGMDIEISGNYDVTDEDVEKQGMSMLNSYGLGSVEVTDRDTVQAGDYVNVDYTGYHDGEAFDKGSAQDVLIDVDNNKDVKSGTTYIDGFSAGLIGATVGSTVSTDVTFPENYGNSDLAGQPATFEFVINGIYQPVTLDTVSDDVIKDNFSEKYNLNSAQEFKDFVRSYLEYQAGNNKYSATVAEVKKQLLASSEVEVPEDYLEARLNEYQTSYEKQYVDETENLETYLKDTYNTSLEDAQSQWRTNLEEQIKVELIFQAIAEKENLEVDDDGYNQFVQNFVDNSQYGFDDTEAVYNAFGNDNAEDGEAYMRKLYLVNKAMDFVVNKANVTVTAADSTGSTDSTEAVESTEQQ